MGDKIGELFREHYGHLRRYAAKIFPGINPEDAKDIVMEAFAIACKPKNLEKIRSYDAPAGFLYKTVQNICKHQVSEVIKNRNMLKVLTYNYTLALSQTSQETNSIPPSLAEEAMREMLVHYLGEFDAELIHLKLVLQYSHAEIAKMKGIAEHVSRSHVSRAKAKLKNIFSDFSENHDTNTPDIDTMYGRRAISERK